MEYPATLYTVDAAPAVRASRAAMFANVGELPVITTPAPEAATLIPPLPDVFATVSKFDPFIVPEEPKEVVPVLLRNVNDPVEGVVAPMEVALTVPPIIATAVLFCTDIVPRPRLDLAVDAKATSDRLLAAYSGPVAPEIAPPVIVTEDAFCTDMEPRPRFVRAEGAEARSERLLARKAYVVSPPVAVTPKAVLAPAAVVAPVPPLSTASVPAKVIVPVPVTGPPVVVNPVEPPDTSTDVTVPAPPADCQDVPPVPLVINTKPLVPPVEGRVKV